MCTKNNANITVEMNELKGLLNNLPTNQLVVSQLAD